MIDKYWFKIFRKVQRSTIVGSSLGYDSKIEAGSEVINSSFGRHSYCGYGCFIIDARIGSFTSIANQVIIGGGSHPMNWGSMSPVFYKGRDSVRTKYSEFEREQSSITTIGSDVWIGRNSMLKSGVEIGHGAVIGMGSVVTKNVAPYSIVAGNPAKLIRLRFDEELIDRLLVSKWWELSEEDLKQVGPYIRDVDLFLAKIAELL